MFTGPGLKHGYCLTMESSSMTGQSSFFGTYESSTTKITNDIMDNKLKVSYHPFNKFFICGEADILNRHIDDCICSVLGMRKEEFQKTLVEQFGGHIKGGYTYFKNGDNAQQVIDWIMGLLIMNKLTENTINDDEEDFDCGAPAPFWGLLPY